MDLEIWIDVGTLSTGRRLFVLEQTRPEAQAIGGNEDIVARIDEATAQEEQTRTLESAWGGVRAGNADPAVVKPIDHRVDKIVTSVRDGAELQRKGAKPDDPIHETVETFLKTAMPEGAFAITSLPYVDQLSATQQLLNTLQGPLAGTVTELGLGRQVSRLAEIVPEYRAALHGTGEISVTFAPVREARQRGQRLLREIVAMILGRYNRDEDPAHREARTRLLTPLWKQMEAARALRGRRNGQGTAPDDTDDTDEPEVPVDTQPGAQPGAQPGEQPAF